MSGGVSLEAAGAAGAEEPMGGYAERYGPWALIAGGSEGIGLSFARRLAARGIHLVLLARRRKPLEEAASLLREEYGVEVRVHAVDLSARDLDRLLDDILHGLEIGLLIYNAGATHGAGLFLDAPLDAARRLVDLNCHGPLVLCHRLGRSMRERGRGGIILLGSMSGMAGSAWVATYSATKSFEVVLAEGLWAELRAFGVDVLALVAGATDTPSMARSGIGFSERDGMSPMQPDEVAEEGLAHLSRGPVHVAGAANRAVAELLRSDRRRAIELLSAGAARLYGKPHPLEVTRVPSLGTKPAPEK